MDHAQLALTATLWAHTRPKPAQQVTSAQKAQIRLRLAPEEHTMEALDFMTHVVALHVPRVTIVLSWVRSATIG